ncbi:unnamed protein product [Chrysodeixis includens]|uniref:Uncharacterized protein n=1 Tax=Chrysodeixis includens TaxID=689277 RepID=A0A9P0BML5_CHRIL|nr:unnamed protein product [Chrysodeixis includens]
MLVSLFAYIYLILFESVIHGTLASIEVTDKGILPLEKDSVGVQFYIDLENNNQVHMCKVISWGKMCCLADQQYKDCSLDTIYGDNVEVVKPQEEETFVYVYPTLYQYDQVGYCDFVIDYKCGKSRRSRQLDVSIPFDTQLAKNKKSLQLKAFTATKGAYCDSLDEDTLNKCKPVNCDFKYSGRRPFFEGSSGKCVSAPVCETSQSNALPDVAYVPKSNTCRDLDHPITLADIYAISTGLGVVTENKQTHKDDMKVLLKSNCSTISQNLILLKDLMFGRLCPIFKGDTTAYQDCCTKALLSICGCIVAICGLLLSIVICLHTGLWFFKKWSKGDLKNTIKNLRTKQGKTVPMPKPSTINREVTNNLLREVIVRDLPIELRDSVVDICQRIDQDINVKKRYRVMDLDSAVNLRQDDSESSSVTTSETSAPEDEEKTRLIK